MSSPCAHVVCLILFDFSIFLSLQSIFSFLSSCLSSWPSTSSSTMWWNNSLCTSANEDLGNLAEYDPLTGYEPNDYRISDATEPYIQESAGENGSLNDPEYDHVSIGKALSSHCSPRSEKMMRAVDELTTVMTKVCRPVAARGHKTKRKDETIHTTTWTMHHQTPQRSTTQHSTSWRSATDAILPGHREHTGGSRQDTHGTPVLLTIRRPWVAQLHEHAYATQVTDTGCEGGDQTARQRSKSAEHWQHGSGAPAAC